MKDPTANLVLTREKVLEKRPVFSIAASLGKLSDRWLNKNYSFRRKAVRRLVEKSFFQERMAQELLDALFQKIEYVFPEYCREGVFVFGC